MTSQNTTPNLVTLPKSVPPTTPKPSPVVYTQPTPIINNTYKPSPLRPPEPIRPPDPKALYDAKEESALSLRQLKTAQNDATENAVANGKSRSAPPTDPNSAQNPANWNAEDKAKIKTLNTQYTQSGVIEKKASDDVASAYNLNDISVDPTTRRNSKRRRSPGSS